MGGRPAAFVLVAVLGTVGLGPSPAAPAAEGARWPDECRAGPFHCHADFSLREHAELINELARLQEDVTSRLGLQQPREPIHLFLFRDKDTYRRYLRAYFPEAPNRRALFIKGRGGPGMVFAFFSPEFAVDVRHECTHALLHATLPMVPLWLDEGLAEYFEVAAPQRAQGGPHGRPLRRMARFGWAPRITDLEQLGRVEEMTANHYRDAWGWVHFMLHGPAAARQELIQYLREIAAHSPPGNLSARLRQRVPEVERQFVTHFRQLQ